jgi:hypothetical protein
MVGHFRIPFVGSDMVYNAEMVVRKPHPHPVGYKADCPQCKAERATIAAKKRKSPAYRAYRAGQKRDQRATRFAQVVNLPMSVAPTGLGENEQALIDQCALLSKAQENPATVAQARSLARIMDCQELSSMWPATSRQLHTLLLSLIGGKKKSKGRLNAVIAMTERSRAAQ